MQIQSSGFWEWMSNLSANDRSNLLMFSAFAVIMLVMILGGVIQSMYKNRLDAALKRDLLDRGLGADEIATIIGARSTPKCRSPFSRYQRD